MARDWYAPPFATEAELRLRPISAMRFPDQGRYGTTSSDPLGRNAPNWHISKRTGLPARTKGAPQDN